VYSKCDLGEAGRSAEGMRVSAKTGENMNELRKRLDMAAFGADLGGSNLTLNGRHLAAIEHAMAALRRGVGAGSAELVAADLREALDWLGTILGQVTPDDVLGKIFAAFCVGK